MWSLLSLQPVASSKAWALRSTHLVSNPSDLVLLTQEDGPTQLLLPPNRDHSFLGLLSSPTPNRFPSGSNYQFFSLLSLPLEMKLSAKQDKTLSVFSCLRLRLMPRWLSLPSLLDLASTPALCWASKKYYPHVPKIGCLLPSPPGPPSSRLEFAHQ